MPLFLSVSRPVTPPERKPFCQTPNNDRFDISKTKGRKKNLVFFIWTFCHFSICILQTATLKLTTTHTCTPTSLQKRMATNESKTAVVWGANGISGAACLTELVKRPASEWSRIIAVSRRPMQSDTKDERVRFVAVDVLKSAPEEIAAKLKEAGGENITHAFHYTYIEKASEKELVDVNTELLDRALRATAEASKNVKMFLLQTGYKVRTPIGFICVVDVSHTKAIY